VTEFFLVEGLSVGSPFPLNVSCLKPCPGNYKTPEVGYEFREICIKTSFLLQGDKRGLGGSQPA
jgi:hypothetical protein